LKAAKLEAWRAAFYELADDMAAKPENVRRRFNRVRKELVEKGVVAEFYRLLAEVAWDIWNISDISDILDNVPAGHWDMPGHTL
jgi:hypothetical protein